MFSFKARGNDHLLGSKKSRDRATRRRELRVALARKPLRLCLESLEQRALLAVVTWDGGAGTSLWEDAANWSSDALPELGDDVVIEDFPSAGPTNVNLSTNKVINSLTLLGTNVFTNQYASLLVHGTASLSVTNAIVVTHSNLDLVNATASASSLTLQSSGSLFGATATINSNVTNVAGTLGWGDSNLGETQPLVIDGNYLQSPTATFFVKLDVRSGFEPRVEVTGAADLSGAITLETSGELLDVSQTYTVLNYASVTGALTTAYLSPSTTPVELGPPYVQDQGATSLSIIGNAHLVTTLADSGPGSLRELITLANASPDPTIIGFRDEFGTISLASPLPVITETIEINAGHNATYAGLPLIELDGSSAGIADGLSLTSSNSIVRGLSIHSFSGDGIKIFGGSNNSIKSNFVGTDRTGTAGFGNLNGVAVQQATNAQIGGPNPQDRNVVSQNELGVSLIDAAGTIIQGNFIGTDVDGLVPLGNQHGIDILNSSNTLIGGTVGSAQNIISGNAVTGIAIQGPNSFGNIVQGNTIGLAASPIPGAPALPNGTGILIGFGANNNEVGTGQSNYISGNNEYGVKIEGSATNNTIISNFIGTGTSVNDARPNGFDGVGIFSGATNNTIAFNSIAANTLSGVLISDVGTSGNQVLGNFIGASFFGTVLGNGNTGVLITNGATNNVIGSEELVYRNIISGNTNEGVRIENFLPGQNTSQNRVEGNFIGTDPTGTIAWPNRVGVTIAGGANNNIVGGTTSTSKNVISGNTDEGIRIEGIGSDNNTVLGNFIGVNARSAPGVAAGWWRAENNTDDFLTLNNGVINGTVPFIPGKVGQAFSFDGSNANYFSVPNSPTLEPTNEVTIEAWVQSSVPVPAGAGLHIIAKGGDDTSASYAFQTGAAGGIEFYVRTSSGIVRTTNVPEATVWDGNWHHVVGVYDGNRVRMYLDGTEVGSANSQSGNIYYGQTNSDLAIAHYSPETLASTGTRVNVDEATVYGRGLTADEIKTIYELGEFGKGGYGALGNGWGVVAVDGASNNQIGGTTVNSRNFVSGNVHGVVIQSVGTSNNTVIGNYIGTDVSGLVSVGNQINGVLISDASDNAIGGTSNAQRNVVSGNSQNNISLQGASDNRVLGNYVGVAANGVTPIAGQNGVFIAGGSLGNFIGGELGAGSNLIGGQNVGVQISGVGNNTIQGNFIGRSETGDIAIPNVTGIALSSVNDIEIFRNVIAENSSFGINLGNTNGSKIRGNTIESNGGAGINLGNSTLNVIGGTTDVDRNVISKNLGEGISLSNSSRNTILGNYIGTDASGKNPRGNTSFGVLLLDSNRNTIGGAVTGAGNLISANSAGIELRGTTTELNTIAGNYVGTDVDGRYSLPNLNDGILVSLGAHDNTIGGTAANARNLISGNRASGVQIKDSGTTNNTVLGNYIGTNAAGTGQIYPYGTVGWWKAENDVLNYVDGTSGSLLGDVTFTDSEMYGKAFQFDGNGDVVSIPDSAALDIGNSITLEAWINPQAFPTSADGALILGKPNGYQLRLLPSGVIRLRLPGVNGGANFDLDSTQTVSLDRWTHIAGTYDQATFGQTSIFIDAFSLTGFNFADARSISSTSGPLQIGGISDGPNQSSYFQGSIDEPAIYSRALDNLSMQRIYFARATGKGEGNAVAGIKLSATDNTIGGRLEGSRNVISGNAAGTGGGAVWILADNNKVEGNYIGTDHTGMHPIGNSSTGVFVESSTGNRIGGGSPGAGNLISGNGLENRFGHYGVQLGNGANGNRVQGNYLGTDATGNAPLINSIQSFGAGYGISIAGNLNFIGDDSDGVDDASEGNVIGDFKGYGIIVGGNQNTIAGNSVGVGADGLASIPNVFTGNAGAGIAVNGNNNLIGGLADHARNVVSGNNRNGIIVLPLFNGSAPDQNRIEGNYVGLLKDGDTARPNMSIRDDAAIRVFGASNTEITRNVVSGNFGKAIGIQQAISSGTIVKSNIIGTNASGTAARPNASGIVVGGGPSDTVIGGSNPEDGNLISGNLGDGIAVTYFQEQSVKTWLRGDGDTDESSAYRFGQQPTVTTFGTVGYEPGKYGEAFSFTSGLGRLESSGGVLDTSNAGATFWFKSSGTPADSVVLQMTAANADGYAYRVRVQADGRLVLDSTDGLSHRSTDPSANSVLDGQWHFITASLDSVLGGLRLFVDGVPTGFGFGFFLISPMDKLVVGPSFTGAIDDLKIYYNMPTQAELDALQTAGQSPVFIENNRIGTNADGNRALPNLGNGISISDEMQTNVVANTIAGNNGSGIRISHYATGIRVQSNFIGTNRFDYSGLGNGDGIVLAGKAHDITIGGADPSDRNVISGNRNSGVVISDLGTTRNFIVGNSIGTNLAGTSALGNAGSGVLISSGASTNTIRNNTLSGNETSGVTISGSNTQANTVVGNMIGTDRDGAYAIGNGIGINIDASLGNIIGGTIEADRNLISGNHADGLLLENGAQANTVYGNWFGVDRFGQFAIGNVLNAVHLKGSSTFSNSIGGGALGAGNLLAYSGQSALRLEDNTSSTRARNIYFNNSFRGNLGLVIDVGGAGPTPNDGLDAFNDLRDYPVLTDTRIDFANPTDPRLVIKGFSQAGRTIYLYVASPTADGRGQGITPVQTFTEGVSDLDSNTVFYDPVTYQSFTIAQPGSVQANAFEYNIPLPAGVSFGTLLTGLSIGSISEFGNVLPAGLTVADAANNLAPIVTLAANKTLTTGENFHVDGKFADDDSKLWRVTVDYGDGSPVESIVYDEISRTFALDHVYTRSQPNPYIVTVRVLDNGGRQGSASMLVQVVNERPVLTFNQFTLTPTVNEGNQVELHGLFSDTGIKDHHVVTIDWGDGVTTVSGLNMPAIQPGDRQFTAFHTYLDDGTFNTRQDTYKVVVSITDGSGNDSTAPGLFLQEVFNVLPFNLTAQLPTEVAENETFILDGSFVDPGIQDAHEVTVDWGDGSPKEKLQLVPYGGIFRGFQFEHVYADNPASPATTYDISIEVADDDEPLSPTVIKKQIKVVNVVPTILNISLDNTSISENGQVTLAALLADPGSLDGHRIAVDWGDGSPETLRDLAPGVLSVDDITHVYRNDPSGLIPSYMVRVKVSDKDMPTTSFVSATEEIVVNNVAPELTGELRLFTRDAADRNWIEYTLGGTLQINEGQRIRVMGSYSDEGPDDIPKISVTWSPGITTQAIVDPGTHTFEAEFRYTDDYALGTSLDTENIAVVADDRDGGISSPQSIDVAVHNVVPTASYLPGIVTDPLQIPLQAFANDPGNDLLTYTWTVSVGATSQTYVTTSPNFTLERTGAETQPIIVELVVNDDDSGPSQAYRTAFLFGTDQDDVIQVGDADFPTGIDKLIVMGLAGSDTIDATNVSATYSVIFVGGANDDHYYGGSGDDIFVMQGGDDDANVPKVGYTPNENGDDRFVFKLNSKFTVYDFVGDNILDFSLTTFGVQFDLSRTVALDADYQIAAPGHEVAAQGNFTELDGTEFNDQFTGLGGATVKGGAGNDKFFAPAGFTQSKMSFFGGNDVDVLTIGADSIVGEISFEGDQGADVFDVFGSVNTIDFGGGADADLLTIASTAEVGNISFEGDFGADLLIVVGEVANIDFSGGADSDVLIVGLTGSVNEISFEGDFGADELTIVGSVSEIDFGGGADVDVLTVSASGVVGEISFEGDQGRDELRVIGRVRGDLHGLGSDNPNVPNRADGHDYSLYFRGGYDVDLLTIGVDAVVSSISFEGDFGADQLHVDGNVDQIDFSGGADNDLFAIADSATVNSISFEGDFGADLLTVEGSVSEIDFSGGADSDLLLIATTGTVNEISFEGDDGQSSGRDRLVILGSVAGDDETDNPLIPNRANGLDYNVYFQGGADVDLLQIGTDSVVGAIDFEGDFGADELTIFGSVSEIDFSGGADNDLLNIVAGSSVSEISFEGDDGADLFSIFGSVNEVDFSGGADADVLTVGVSGTVNEISFEGDGDPGETGEFLGSRRDRLVIAGTVHGDSNPLHDNPRIPNLPFTNIDYSVYFRGGADVDVLTVLSDSSVSSISFEGDFGADQLTVSGSVDEIDFSGGADADIFTLSTAGAVGEISFEGDAGADIFDVFGSVVGNIEFSGGADADRFRNFASGVESIRFYGFDANPFAEGREQDGDDLFLNRGSNIGELFFKGDFGADVFQIVGSNIGDISFEGDQGADVFIVNGSFVDSIDFSGGADADVFSMAGAEINNISFEGDFGNELDANDTFINRATAATSAVIRSSITFLGRGGSDAFRNDGANWDRIIFIGGTDNDVFQNNGQLVNEISFEGDEGADIFENNENEVQGLVFSGGSGNNVFVNDGDNVSNAIFFGGSDVDVFLNTGSFVNEISFEGDDGADLFTNLGVSVANISFEGDSGNDQFVNSGTGLTNANFWGGAGRDTFVNRASGKLASGLHFYAGSRPLGSAIAELPYNGEFPISIPQDTPSQADDSADLFLNYASQVNGIRFEGDFGADIFQNFGSNVSDVTFEAGADDDQALNQGAELRGFHMVGNEGNDVFENRGTGSADLDFDGGDGDDSLIQSANSVSKNLKADAVSFIGGAGVDVFANYGNNVSSLKFVGGSENDRLLNSGNDVGSIWFVGNAGNDALQNNGNRIDVVRMEGGDDEDSLFNNGSSIELIDFDGGMGANTLINTGNSIGVATVPAAEPTGILFTGGNRADLLRVQGKNLVRVVFVSGDGDDALLYNATGTNVKFVGGRGNDVFSYRGTATNIEFDGEEGNDRSIFAGITPNLASVSATLDGGVGNDRYEFVGTPSGYVLVVDDFTGVLDASQDVLDFSSFTSGSVSIDLSSVAPQPLPGNLTIQLSSSMGIEQIIGSSGADSLMGNDRNNFISGAEYFQPINSSNPVPVRQETQWVLLDFDTYTEPTLGEHIYTPAERIQIQQRIEGVYYGYESDGHGGLKSRSFDSPQRWFNIRFTTNPHEIEAAEVANYVTIKFNNTSSFGRPGGKSSEIDLGNANFGGFADVQVNGLLGGIEIPVAASEDFTEQLPEDTEQAVGQEKPAAISANFVALSAKIAAHELGHLLGLRHYDAFGPIGFGIHSPPGVAEFKPQYQGTSAAFETFDHIIGSPASVGSTRANDIGQLFFGEREAVKIATAMADPSQVVFEESNLQPTTISIGDATAQGRSLNLATIQVANTLGKGLNSSKNFYVQAASIIGSIGLVNGHSESDYYSFTGHAADLVTIEIASAALDRFVNQGAGGYIDSIVRLRDANGNLVQAFNADAVNDDEFESSDSLLMDIRLPYSGLYTIEVDTFFRSSNDSSYQDLLAAIGRLQNLETLTLEQQELLDRLLESQSDTDVGNYQLFIYSFAAASQSDGVNTLRGRGGIDTIVGSTGENYNLALGQLPTEATATPNSPFVVPISFVDKGGESWSALVHYGDGSFVVLSNFTPESGIPIDHTYTQAGLFDVTIELSNDDGQSVSGSFKIKVGSGAGVPTATIHAAPSTILEGGLTVVSLQPDTAVTGSSLHYFFSTSSTARNSASYLSSSPVNNQAFDFDDNGSFTVYARVMDNANAFSDYEITITVNNVAPTAAISGPATISEGGSTTVSMTGGSDASNVDANSLRYFFSNSTAARNASTYAAGGSTASQLFTFDDNGTFVVYGRVIDKDGAFSDYQTTITVNNVAPTATINGQATISEGGSTTISLSGGSDASSVDASSLRYFFSTSAAARDASTYAGSGSTASQQFTFNDNGTFIVYGRVVDKDGGYSDYQTTITVNNVAPTALISGPAAILEGGSTTVSLSGGSDASSVDASSLRYFFSTSAAARNASTYAGSGSTASQLFTFNDNGTFVVYGRVIDKDGGFSDYQTTITVNNVAPTALTSGPATISEGGSTTVSLSSGSDASSVDANSLRYFFSTSAAARNASTYAGSDSTTSQLFTFDDNETFVVYGRVIDKDGGFSDYQTTITVNNVAPTALISGPATISEGGSTTVSLSSGSDASNVDANSLRYFFSTSASARNASTYAGSGSTASQLFTFNDNGTVVVYGRVIDKDGGFSDYQTTVTVNNVAPTALISGPTTISEGGSTTVSLSSGSDASNVDTNSLRYFFSTSAAARNASTYAGSGSTAIQLFTFNDNGTFVVYGRVVDKDGGFSDYQTTVTVNNVAPTALISGPTTISEGGSTTVSLSGGTDASSVDAGSLRYFFSTSAAARNASTYAGSSSTASQLLTFNDNGTFVVYGRVLDKDGGYADYQATITVNNVAPTAVINAPASSLEGNLVTINMIGTDASSVDAGTLRYFFATSAATRNAATYATSTATANQSIRYTDNGTYIVYMRVMDKDGGLTDYQTSIVVNNVAPTATINPAVTISEGSSTIISLTGASDVSNVETATLRFYFSMSAAARNAATYATSGLINNQDFQFGDNGAFVVYARVVDKDGGYSDFQTTVNVSNVAPTPSIVSVSNPIRTGSAISLVGSATDPAGANDTLTYVWNVHRANNSTPSFTGSGVNFSFTPTLVDNYRVDLTVSEEDGGSRTVSTSLAVGATANTKPTLVLTPPSDSVFYTATNLQLTATDSDAADQAGLFTYVVQWGDGTSSTVTGAASTTISHQYTTVSPTGAFTITATATDARGLSSSLVTASLIVQGWAVLADPLAAGKAVLVVVGGQSNDTLEVRDQVGDFVNVKVNNRLDSVRYRNTPVGNVSRILVFGNNGNDTITLASTLTIDATIWGGLGNDLIKSGAGNDVVFGDDGDDTIFGGEGRDLLIGGLGSDRISGDGNEDILIAGYTLYDSSYNNTAPLRFDQRRLAVEAMIAEWASNLTQAQRKANLLGAPAGTTWNDRKNGNAFLRSNLAGSPNNTVFDDLSVDYLTGGAGVDWFFANIDVEAGTIADILLDRASAESQQDIDRWS